MSRMFFSVAESSESKSMPPLLLGSDQVTEEEFSSGWRFRTNTHTVTLGFKNDF